MDDPPGIIFYDRSHMSAQIFRFHNRVFGFFSINFLVFMMFLGFIKCIVLNHFMLYEIFLAIYLVGLQFL